MGCVPQILITRVIMLSSNSYKAYPWREVSYHSFYQAADNVVEDIQNLVWVATGKVKRRLKGDQLEKLTYSVEKLMRDSLAVVIDKGKIPNCPIAKSKLSNLHHSPSTTLCVLYN